MATRKAPLFCSFIPREILHCAGIEMKDIAPRGSTRIDAGYHCVMHENLCSYAKYLYERISGPEECFSDVVVPNTCDAMKKLYSALTDRLDPERTATHLVDVPRNTSPASAAYLGSRFFSLHQALYRGADALGDLKRAIETLNGPGGEPERAREQGAQPCVGVAGTVFPVDAIATCLESFDVRPVLLRHCGTARGPLPLGGFREIDAPEALCRWLAERYLETSICPRTQNDGFAASMARAAESKSIDALIVSNLKFCDFVPFELESLKQRLPPGFPVLFLEQDLSVGMDEQITNRIGTFMESVFGTRRGAFAGAPIVNAARARNLQRFVGVDSGSTTVKVVIVDEKGCIVEQCVEPQSVNMRESAQTLMARLLERQHLENPAGVLAIVTGYGRHCLNEYRRVTEISCHAKGVFDLLARSATIIDVGGQDSKVIRCDDRGNIISFVMNDKCAAGTGHFIESMVRKMKLDYETFNKHSLAARRATNISSMCSVFAESEVISLLARGEPIKDICRGINTAIARRIAGLVRRLQGEPPYLLSGGVALNRGFVKALAAELGHSVIVAEHPQLTGALGAALMAREDAEGEGS